MVLAGSSNVNRWSCRSGQFQKETAAGRERISEVRLPLHDITIAVPVRSLTCGHDRMNADLYAALRADAHPEIRFVLTGYRIDRSPAAGTDFSAVATGDLTVAGATRAVEIPVVGRRTAAGVRGSGTLALRMTDFGVKPPVALLGLIRARDEIDVSFDVLLDTSLMVAGTQP